LFFETTLVSDMTSLSKRRLNILKSSQSETCPILAKCSDLQQSDQLCCIVLSNTWNNFDSCTCAYSGSDPL